MPIHILTPTVAAQIAAGEVIERPASVIKELVENALDAGASQISVEARGGGLRELKVQDNGCGIPADEVELAFERHATSKLHEADDLWALQTLGFRGEALPSIASVAQVVCITRSASSELGTELRIAGGEVQYREARGCSPGTSISVRNLFYNTPVRRDYLRSDATELSAISQVVQQYALASPDVRFTLLLDGRLALQTSGNGDLRDVVIELYGLEVARQLLPIAADYGEGLEAVHLNGLVSPPGLTRGTRSSMHLFVNRRAIQPRGPLAAVVTEAYHTMLMKGRHPLLVLDLRVHPAAVDVNIHPTKSEVRFRYQARVAGVVGRVVRDALLTQSDAQAWLDSVPAETVQRRFEVRPPAPLASAWNVGSTAWTPLSRWDVGGAPATPAVPAAPAEQPDDHPPLEDTADLEPVRVLEPDEDEAPAQPSALPPLRVVGQVGLTYIVAESPDGMYLIDQHAAHERITYERLMQQRSNGPVEAQELLMPQTATLPPAAVALLLAHNSTLQEWGFALDEWGEGLLRVRAVPATLPAADVQQALLAIADYLGGQGGSAPPDWREAMLTTLSCHTSVRAGQALSLDEMRELLQQLERCINPHTCPHGRPTMVLLTPGQLEKQFGRRV
ncbi:MAG: DNA mismatch repair endonuclease MutL [Chloroflexaceae bacterium]|nr:DNA mismatch repair endonuclease MutL [Chloroflexaceae bacterium]